MKRLELEIVGYHNSLQDMRVNNQKAKIIRDKAGKRSCSFELEEDEAEIVIYKTHHYIGKAWFWWNLLYFIVSIFGIFDIRHGKFFVIDCRFKISLKENTKATLKVQNFQDKQKLIEFESEDSIEEISNIAYYDKEAQNKHKKMRWAKLGIAFGIILTTILLIVLI